MNICYDIQLLGYGHHSGSIRAGLYRYAEELASQLVAAQQCHVRFYAGSNYFWAREYMAAHPQLSPYELCSPPLRTLINELPEIAGGFKPAFRLLRKIVSFSYSTGRNSHLLSALCQKDLERSDIIHSPYNVLPDDTIGRKRPIRFLTIHDIIPLIHEEYFEEATIQSTSKMISSVKPEDFIIANSQYTKSDICNYTSIAPAQIIVTHLAADNERFYPCSDTEQLSAVRQKYGIPDAPYILGLSTLEPRKNIEHVIRCFARLVTENNIKDLYLVLAGSRGWLYDGIFEDLKRLNHLQDRVIVTGFVDDSDLAGLYNGAIAFAYMSFYEGFGLPPLEAMQCGVPVITSNNSSLPEVVGDAGIMLDPHDTDGLCHSLWQLYNDASLRSKYRRQSLNQAKRFSWKRCCEDTIRAYETALHL